MKLATLRDGSRDGRLVVVSRDLTRASGVPHIARTLQAALDDWTHVGPRLRDVAAMLETGAEPTERFHERDALSPLPRAYQWADGSAYVNHVELAICLHVFKRFPENRRDRAFGASQISPARKIGGGVARGLGMGRDGMWSQVTIDPLCILSGQAKGCCGKGRNVPVRVGGSLRVDIVRVIGAQMIQNGLSILREIGIQQYKMRHHTAKPGRCDRRREPGVAVRNKDHIAQLFVLDVPGNIGHMGFKVDVPVDQVGTLAQSGQGRCGHP